MLIEDVASYIAVWRVKKGDTTRLSRFKKEKEMATIQ